MFHTCGNAEQTISNQIVNMVVWVDRKNINMTTQTFELRKEDRRCVAV